MEARELLARAGLETVSSFLHLPKPGSRLPDITHCVLRTSPDHDLELFDRYGHADGDQTLFVRRDEVEAQWAWIDAILARWAESGLAPKPYTAGTWGPNAAIALAERDGVSWHE